MLTFDRLNLDEQKWFELILSKPINYRTILWEQIRQAFFKREYHDNHFFVDLKYEQPVERIPISSRCVLVNMLSQHCLTLRDNNEKVSYSDNPDMDFVVEEGGNYPTMFLLHANDGLIQTLEIFTVDGSPIDINHLTLGHMDYSILPALKPYV